MGNMRNIPSLPDAVILNFITRHVANSSLLHFKSQRGHFNQRCTLPALTARLNICLHRPCKKPLSPVCTVQMSDTKVSPVPIPLLAAVLGADGRTVLLSYGNHLQPVMEKVVSIQEAMIVHVCSVLEFFYQQQCCYAPAHSYFFYAR